MSHFFSLSLDPLGFEVGQAAPSEIRGRARYHSAPILIPELYRSITEGIDELTHSLATKNNDEKHSHLGKVRTRHDSFSAPKLPHPHPATMYPLTKFSQALGFNFLGLSRARPTRHAYHFGMFCPSHNKHVAAI